jgi:hypothetical protein
VAFVALLVKQQTKGIMINIEDLTIKQVRELQAVLGSSPNPATLKQPHPMLGRRCLIRTYSAGVHIGDVESVESMEVRLKNSLRLWKWEGGGLSLSAVANNGIKGGRLDKTGEVYLTNVIEMIPTTEEAEKTYVKFIEK